MSKLIIAKIEDGTVIDHIPQGKALAIVKALSLNNHPFPMMVATHLSSKKRGEKDLLKIASYFLSDPEIFKISILAPDATLSWVREGEVVEKRSLVRPKEARGLWACPNPICIAKAEPSQSHFKIACKKHEPILTCAFCFETIRGLPHGHMDH